MMQPPLWFLLLECEQCSTMRQVTAGHGDNEWELPKHCDEPMRIAASALIVPQSPLLH